MARPSHPVVADARAAGVDGGGNSLADQLADHAVELDGHPVPHPGCCRCDVAIVASRRSQAGIRRTRPRGAPNRVRVVDLGDGGLLFVPKGAA